MDTPLFLNREIRLIYLAFILINLYNIPQGKKISHMSLLPSENVIVQWRQLCEATSP